MPNVYKPGLVQIRPQYTPNAETAEIPQNILWFQSAQTTTPTLQDITNIAEDFDDQWKLVFPEYAAANAKYTGCIATDWSSDTGLEWSTVGIFTPEPGSFSGEPLPSNVALLISWTIQLRWRGGHFRSYLPYISGGALAENTNNQVSATVNANVVSAVQTMITGMKANETLGGQTLVMFKEKDNAALAALYVVQDFTVSNFVASQRRRLRKVTRK